MLGAVLETLSGVNCWIKGTKQHVIHSWQGRLHSDLTVLLLTSLSALTAAKQYLGDPIHCIFDGRSGVKTEAIDAFCWIHATFPLEPGLIDKLSNLSPGPPHISRLCSTNQDPPPDTSFYQWVHIFLIVQAVLFLLPLRVWVALEGGRVSSLCLMDVRDYYHDIDRWRVSVESFLYTLKQNNWYLIKFLICEGLQMIILLSTIHLTDIFLSGQFYALGLNTVQYLMAPPIIRKDMTSPTCQVFPTVTSCQFPTGSLTGTVNIDHALCVLSLNIVNDKIFLIEWFWFLFLIFVSLTCFITRAISLIFPGVRLYLLKSTDISFRMEDDKVIRRVVSKCRLGDWFLLTMVRRNLDDRQFTSWIKEVDDRMVYQETLRKERGRRREDRNGHGAPHWPRGERTLIRERKCFTIEQGEKEGSPGLESECA